jgi:hypothetical protein
MAQTAADASGGWLISNVVPAWHPPNQVMLATIQK